MSRREEDWRTALSFLHSVTENEEIGFGEIFFFVSLDEAEDLRGRPVLYGKLVSRGGTDVGGMERRGDDRVTGTGPIGSKRKKGYAKLSFEGIGSGAKDRNVASPINRNDISFQELRRRIGTVDEDVRLAKITEGLQNVSGGDEIALRVDEESVAEECVTEAFAAGSFVARIDDGADSGLERGIGLFRGVLLRDDAASAGEGERDEKADCREI